MLLLICNIIARKGRNWPWITSKLDGKIAKLSGVIKMLGALRRLKRFKRTNLCWFIKEFSQGNTMQLSGGETGLKTC